MLLVDIVVTFDMTVETFQIACSRCLRESSHEGFTYRNGGHLLPLKIYLWGKISAEMWKNLS